MKRSIDRILTTHTGSLPRSPDLAQLLTARDAGRLEDEAAFQATVRAAVAEVVRKQVEVGVDVVDDGEQGKISYSTYVKDRLTGFGGRWKRPYPADVLEFPEAVERMAAETGRDRMQTPACIGPVAYRDRSALDRDLDNFAGALRSVAPAEAFLTAASPGVIALFLQNQYYPSHQAYLEALADAMKVEYDAVYRAGYVLQVDCPDLAMGRHMLFAGESLESFLRTAELHVEILNHALRDIPPDRLRMHLCWGNYAGPHHLDVPLQAIIGVVFKARPAAISFEAANPRHAHEWKVFQDVKVPDGKVIIPGVLDSTTNFIEHPELVAERIVRFAELVGRENVIAGSDCGFGTTAARNSVLPGIVWAKLGAMAEGACLASKQLW